MGSGTLSVLSSRDIARCRVAHNHSTSAHDERGHGEHERDDDGRAGNELLRLHRERANDRLLGAFIAIPIAAAILIVIQQVWIPKQDKQV